MRSPHEHVADRPVGPAAELGPPRKLESAPRIRHAGRFRWMVAGLFALGAASLVAAVALSASTTRVITSGGSWSAWQPADTGLAGAQEIADFVAPYYRATPAEQLAVITAVNLNNPSNPLQVAIPASGSSGSLVPLPASSTIVYNLCGVASKDCSIGVGQPSSNRLLLLRREALELALYTFKYLGSIQSVVAILPPGHTVQGCTGICAKPQEKTTTRPLDIALAFDRAELTPWLSHPLRATLPEDLPPTVSQMPNAPEAELVSIITAHGLFSEQTEQSQAGSTVMTLSPMPPQ
ncbi:MAG TPA: hypothetical protein VMP89_05525 [Solirubrobacteraceae bacterium]|nr:hypothetical protein [Solirubrobacteraceae bacterium]